MKSKLTNVEKHNYTGIYNRYIKRFFDFVISLVSLLVLIPIFAVVSIAIKLESKGPVIFKQQRIGKDGKVFNIYKFRSMCVGAENTGSGVYSGKGDTRVTKVGKFIRATSIDELPQLVNIIKGDMSFVGPRPPLTYHPWPIEEYSDEQLKMFLVRPGITGWAQVNGRKGVEWHKRIELNVWYVNNVSILLDCAIMIKTVAKVVTNADNENTEETVKQEEKTKEKV